MARLRVEYLLWQNRHMSVRPFFRARWTCSSCGRFCTDSQQLMELARTSPQFDHPVPVSGANFLDWQQRSHTFSAMAAYGGSRMTRFDPSSGAEMVHAMRVSPNFFSSVLQVRPEYGRDFRTDEDRPQSSRVVLLSHAVAEQWFGNAAQAVGTHLTLDSQPFAVIGVLPKSFRFELTSTADLWVPATILPGVNRGSNAWVSPNFFATMKIPLIHGRPFNNEDNHPDSRKTVIVSQSLAQHYFPGENPIGQRMKFDADGFANSWIVVGVVADTRYFGWTTTRGFSRIFHLQHLVGETGSAWRFVLR
jgi:hypothetical protein